jgi:hypothetical protein
VLRASLFVALAAAALGLGLGLGSGASAAPPIAAPSEVPRCYGAAARDRAHPCTNGALRTRVTPTPDEALLVPDAPCTSVQRLARIEVCNFGAPAAEARATVALVGDSHAASWRAALTAAAETEGWHGVSITKSSCPFSRARPRIAPEARGPCRRFNDGVIAWLAAHPEVRDVFVSAHSGAAVIRRGGRTSLETKVAGYEAAWAALPATVRRIVILRDGPTHPLATADCINADLAANRPSMPACAVRRSGALITDAEVVAARRLHSRRVRVVDLTSFMCGTRSCYPVVGGVLINKDTNHLSQAFSTTLGPYLLRRAKPLLAAR